MINASLAKFPSEIQQAHERWLNGRELAALDAVLLAVVAYHLPSREQHEPLPALDDSAQLIADLGYDSLAIAEIVFFIEDLYGVALTNEDLRSIRTIGELRSFARAKIAGPATT